MNARVPVLAMAGVLLFLPSLQAQVRQPTSPVGNVGIRFIVAEPLGEFSDYVDAGFGAGLSGRIPLDPTGVVSLRADLGFLIYGYESKRVCFDGIGCRVQTRLQTSNNIFFGGIGPELALPLDWARPYVNAFIGFGYFNTTSSLESLWGGEDQFQTENLGDGTFSWGFGGGLEMYVHRGRVPVAIDLGARYHRNGVMRYLTKGDILDHPDGSITLFPITSEADLMSYELGVSIGIPRKGRDEERENWRHDRERW